MIQDREETTPRVDRRRKLGGVLGLFVAVLAVIAIPVLLMNRATDEGKASIAIAQRATAAMIDDLESQAREYGGAMDQTWTARPMGEMQMVEVTLRSPIPELTGRAAFMVDPESGAVEPQDRLASRLAMNMTPGMSHP